MKTSSYNDEFRAEVQAATRPESASPKLSWFFSGVLGLDGQEASLYLWMLRSRNAEHGIEETAQALHMDPVMLNSALDGLQIKGLVRDIGAHLHDNDEVLEITDPILAYVMDSYGLSRFIASIKTTNKRYTMKYHNPQTHADDFRCNNSFRFKNFLGQSALADDLERVCSAVISGKETDDKALADVKMAFGCPDEDAVLLAVLAHMDGYVSSPSRLAAMVGKPLAKVEAGLARLFESGLINQLEVSDAIILTRIAVMCIGESCCLADISDHGIIATLRDASDDTSFLTESFSAFLKMRPAGRFATFVDRNGLDKIPGDQQVLFWQLCRSYLMHFTASLPGDFSSKAMSELIKKGWVETFASSGDNSELTRKDNYCLSSSVAGALFRGHDDLIDYAALSALATFKYSDDIEEKPLFYCDSDRPAIEKLARMSGEDEYLRITRGLEERKLKVALSAILHGASGTGKTELVRQIARKTGRNLLLVDASKIHGSYWGEDERNLRDLFRLFRHVAALSRLAPILFIDEAEGLLGKRVSNASSRADRSSNVVQNILLEELNDFRGLLFVTTNDVTNLDPAMDRRFLLKIEFHVPDEGVRTQIWRSMMPSLDESTVVAIARDYPFSGGHIENVVRQASIDEILDGIHVDTEKMAYYCEKEVNFTGKSNIRKIGF